MPTSYTPLHQSTSVVYAPNPWPPPCPLVWVRPLPRLWMVCAGSTCPQRQVCAPHSLQRPNTHSRDVRLTSTRRVKASEQPAGLYIQFDYVAFSVPFTLP